MCVCVNVWLPGSHQLLPVDSRIVRFQSLVTCINLDKAGSWRPVLGAMF